MTLGDVVTEIRNGIDLEQFDRPTRTATWPISRIETISEARIDLDRVKYVSPTPQQVQRYQLRSGDILFSHINSPEHIGKTALFTGQHPLIHGINLLLLRADTARCCPAYLDALLKSSGVRLHFRMRCKKAVNQASLNQDDILSLQVRLPSLSDQQRIAGRVEQADRLVRTRRYALELTDTFLPAAFLELFGDPVKNPRCFDHVELEDELECIESGFSPICEGPRESVSQWAVLGLGAVTTGTFKPVENKRLPDDVPPRPELEVHDGDVLVTRKNTYELVAACALVRTPPQRLLLPDTIFRFRSKQGSRLSPVFLWGLFSFPSFRKRVQGLASGSAGSMPGISKDKFMGINCPVPPLPLQQKFAALVERVEQLRAVQREALRHAEHLFASLLDCAFSG